jgi:tetratricopeptide (TPR) repeat protein
LEGIPDAGRTQPMTQPSTSPRFGPGSLPPGDGSYVSNSGNGDENVRPFVPPSISAQGGTTGGRTGDPDPTVVANNDNGERNGMIVDVRPSAGQGSTTNSNVTAEDRGAQIDSLIRVAREKQAVGDWARAADAYEKALALGASPASTNQRLAQCYEKLGKKAEAIKAYERAITAFEKLDPNDVRVQAQLDSCRQALKLLRGN